jgi:hypothetical protein
MKIQKNVHRVPLCEIARNEACQCTDECLYPNNVGPERKPSDDTAELLQIIRLLRVEVAGLKQLFPK